MNAIERAVRAAMPNAAPSVWCDVARRIGEELTAKPAEEEHDLHIDYVIAEDTSLAVYVEKRVYEWWRIHGRWPDRILTTAAILDELKSEARPQVVARFASRVVVWVADGPIPIECMP